MSAELRPDASRLPTLTEVVDPQSGSPREGSYAGSTLPVLLQVLTDVAAHPIEVVAPAHAPVLVVAPPDLIDEAKMTGRILADIQRRADQMLEFRLREALAPVLARVSETLVQEARDELSKTLRDVVGRAVSQEISKSRAR